MKIPNRVCLCASLVLLTSCMSTNVTVPFDRTHPAHPLAQVGENYSAPAVFSLDPLSRLNEKFEEPTEGMSRMHHQMMERGDDVDPMEGVSRMHHQMMERGDKMDPMEGMSLQESSDDEMRSDKMPPMEGDYQ